MLIFLINKIIRDQTGMEIYNYCVTRIMNCQGSVPHWVHVSLQWFNELSFQIGEGIRVGTLITHLRCLR